MTTTANSGRLGSRLWLAVAPTAACWADVVMTLLGQGATYWSGRYGEVLEFNPFARVLLTFHPVAFVAAALASSILVAAVIVRGPRSLAVFASFVVTFCHSVAAASWLLRLGSIGGVIASVFILIGAERLLSWTWRIAGDPISP